ncbi:Polysaccharide deacetylase [Streptococcus suis 05HAS68]|nr:Polysaccharide deacetylase [Streptococcus suis 05HAS68]
MTSESSEVQTEIIWEQQTEPIKLPILMYHAIHVMAPEEEANANLIVDPTTFESHLKALQDAGYYTLSPEEAYKVLTENVLPAGKKVVWLTFDDSLWDFYSYAYPLLKQYQMKATNNVITGFTEYGQAGYLTLDQIKEMQTAGLSFQGHTVNHPDLEYSSIEDQTNELTSSKAYLDSQLNQETIAIAYPGGRYSADTVALTEQAGYKLGVTTNNGLASASDGLLTLNRVRILPTTTAENLLAEIAY